MNAEPEPNPPAATPPAHAVSAFEHMMGHPHVFSAVLYWFNAFSLIAMSYTSRYMHHVVTIYKKEAFSVNRALQPFFTEYLVKEF